MPPSVQYDHLREFSPIITNLKTTTLRANTILILKYYIHIERLFFIAISYALNPQNLNSAFWCENRHRHA